MEYCVSGGNTFFTIKWLYLLFQCFVLSVSVLGFVFLIGFTNILEFFFVCVGEGEGVCVHIFFFCVLALQQY